VIVDDADDADGRDVVLSRVAPRWSATRTEDNLAMTFRRLERRRRMRGVGLGVAVVGALALVAGLAVRRPTTVATGPGPAAPVRADARRLQLDDGSLVMLADPRARLVVGPASDARVELTLEEGRGSFEVPARGAREVIVKVARFEVVILAAKFDLNPEPMGDRLKVSVTEGRVDVRWPGGSVEVSAGETASLPPPPDEAPHAPQIEPPPANAPAAQRSRFRAEVARRDYVAAFRSLERAPTLADHSSEDLMLAADAARLSGHPAAAVPYLRRLVRAFPNDVRAPVAAFTLGRVLLAELARPADAADAFALAHRLAPTGPLAADALAREVEAAAQAGDRARARRLAERYLAEHPGGPGASAVRRAGGLE
jgi:transmembrane sensor